MLSNAKDDKHRLSLLIEMRTYLENLTDDELISYMGGELLPEFIDNLSLKETMELFYCIRDRTPYGEL